MVTESHRDFIARYRPTPLETCHIFLRLSWFSFLNSVLCYRYVNDNSYLIPFGVFASTQLYWRDPAAQWKRLVDITYVASALACQLWYGWGRPGFKAYVGFTLSGVLCYPVGHYYHNRGEIWKGCYWHTGLHILANIGLLALNVVF